VDELESRLLNGRKIMVFGQINDKLARDVVARILTLAEESTKPIQIYVNSPVVMSNQVTQSTISSSSCARACRCT